MREEGAKHPAPPRAASTNPWGEANAPLSSLATSFPTLDHDDARADRYNEWAERMREKRRRLREDEVGEATPSYWSTDAVFEESRRIENEEQEARPNPWRIQELLATLDLRGDPTAAMIADAYRRLAKQHHPDRYLDAEPAIQEFHADKMREIISAYRTLKTLPKS
jgi:hypothetical protein